MAQVQASFRYHLLATQMTRGACETSDRGVLAAGEAGNPNSPTVGVLIKANQRLRTYNGPFSRSLRAVTQLADGNLAAAGFAFRSIYAGDERFWALKPNPQGNVIWEREFGAAGEQATAQAMVATPDGGFIMAGLKLANSPSDTPWSSRCRFRSTLPKRRLWPRRPATPARTPSSCCATRSTRA
ncbi:MAG TPA: hypothetical protein VKU19_24935 [Bryobacteraceae bacterium]|nr:hypothetical protein [Bryobacteraceae bacterium]